MGICKVIEDGWNSFTHTRVGDGYRRRVDMDGYAVGTLWCRKCYCGREGGGD